MCMTDLKVAFLKDLSARLEAPERRDGHLPHWSQLDCVVTPRLEYGLQQKSFRFSDILNLHSCCGKGEES